MTLSSLLQLIILAAIWGGSFLLMRITANQLGPAFLIEFRVLFAAITLFFISIYLRKSVRFREHSKHYFILGLFNTALPFLLFAYAAQTLNASLLSILNSTAAIWGAIISAIMTKILPTKKVIFGLVMGIFGVCILVGGEAAMLGEGILLPILAGTLAAFCYGLATNYAKNAPKIESFNNAHGSMWAAVIIVLPFLPFFPYREAPTTNVFLAVVGLGVVCTALAYVLYFKLIADVGPAPALSVAFLIPVFGILWGKLFLDEAIGSNTVFGAVFVIFGTMLVTGFSPNTLFKKRG